MTVYRVYVACPGTDGSVSTWIESGTVVEIAGQQYVRGSHVMVPLDETWHGNLDDAKRAGAERIERIAATTMESAAALRKGVPDA